MTGFLSPVSKARISMCFYVGKYERLPNTLLSRLDGAPGRNMRRKWDVCADVILSFSVSYRHLPRPCRVVSAATITEHQAFT